MEKIVNFRDRQELQAADLSNIETFATESFDRLVREGVTDEKKYSGFEVAKTGATTISIAAGTYWTNGERYISETTTTMDFLSQLPLVTKKIITIIVVGSNVATDVEPRDYLIDVDTGATEPQSVAMQTLRRASFQTAIGAENATPQRPTIATDVIGIAHITLNTTGVESVEMDSDNELVSVKSLDLRATELEVWREAAGDQITTLATDIANISSKLAERADTSLLTRLFDDVAAIKDQLDIADDASGYGSENFMSLDQSISDNGAVGYYAKVEEGLRFTNANAWNGAVTLFNPIEPTVSVASDGLVLPSYTQVRRLSIDTFFQEMSLSQYEYQTVNYKNVAMSAQRLRFGLAFTICVNREFWKTGRYDSQTGVFTDKLGRTYQVLDSQAGDGSDIGAHTRVRLQRFWYDTETTYYVKRVTTDESINGAMTAQTFLNSQAGWLTSIDLFFTQVASSGSVRVLLTGTDDQGKPDLSNVLAKTTVNASALVKGTNPKTASHWTRISFTPTALEAGGRYAIVPITGGAHYVGLAQGTEYGAGTLFYSTDGAFLQGDLTKDMMFRTNFAKFAYKRLEVDLGSVNLSGGINDIDIAYEGITPAGTSLSFEIRPQGSSVWYPLGGDGNPFTGLPALVNMRAVFVGTKDLMPGFRLTGSDVEVSRPATTMTWFSDLISLPASTQSIKVVVTLDYFNPTNHTFALVLNANSNTANKAAGSIVDEVLEQYDATYRRVRRTYTWTASQLTSPTNGFVMKATGTLTAATEVYHVERLVYMSFV